MKNAKYAVVWAAWLVACSADDGGGPASPGGSGGMAPPGAGGNTGGLGGASAGGTSAGGAGLGGASSSGGASSGGTSSGGAAGGGTRPGWPTFEQARQSPLSSRLLVVLLDFSDSSMTTLLPEPEPAWSGLMFGTNPAEANHFYYEVSGGKFQLLKAKETFGVADNGVVAVKLSSPRPTTGKHLVQDQTWIPEALDKAAQFVDFASFDADHDGHVENLELAVMFVLNLDYAFISGAGAEANIRIDHSIPGQNVVLDKFARVQKDYTSIGTPCHELAHHILDLDHAPAPNVHDLMGTGAYAEDPVIGQLHFPEKHYATRPTSLTGIQKILAKFVTPTTLTDSAVGVALHSPHTLEYNVLKIPVVDGFVYLENRTAEGYDRSIPFCDGHAGGLFLTDSAQYLFPINIPGIARRLSAASYDVAQEAFCDFYGLKGHNDSFAIGQYTITNVSPPGPAMTFDIVKNATAPSVTKHMFNYFVKDPSRAGYQMRHFETATPGGTATVDFATFTDGENASGYFTISLDVFYSTGERRSVDSDTTFTSSSPYVTVTVNPLSTNPGTSHADSIVRLQLNQAAPYASTAVIHVTHGTFTSSLTLTNLPRF